MILTTNLLNKDNTELIINTLDTENRIFDAIKKSVHTVRNLIDYLVKEVINLMRPNMFTPREVIYVTFDHLSNIKLLI